MTITAAARRAYVVQAIEGISAQLKGPGVSTAERLVLHEDRKDFRRELAEIDAAAVPDKPTSSQSTG